MTQAIDLITNALIQAGAVAPGESIEASQATFALSMLNGMLDQWSNESMMVYAKQEVIHEITGGTYIYTIGPGGDIASVFTGSISGNVLTVTALTSGAISVGMTISGAGVTANSVITSVGTGRGGNTAAALGTYYLNESSTVGPITITAYAQRPLKINSAFVRVVNSITGVLDFPIAIWNLEQYELVGIKTLPGPWPRALYYQPTEPLGVINYYQNPSTGEVHLFCDTLLNQFYTINDTVTLPQGYAMGIMWNLAEILLPSYGKNDPTQIAMIEKNAAKGRGLIKRTNMQPQQIATFDDAIQTKSRNDAGFVIHGGFN